MLTVKLRKTLDAIIKYQADNGGVSPAMTDIAAAIGVKHKSGAHRLVTALEERGYLRRLPNRNRAIEVLPVRLPSPAPRRKPSPGMIPIYDANTHKIMGFIS